MHLQNCKRLQRTKKLKRRANVWGKKRKGRFEAPHVFVILFTLIIAASIMTYLIPAGHFERVELGGRMVIDPESFVYVEQTPVGIFAALNCITAGIGEVSEIIAFLLIMGEAFM